MKTKKPIESLILTLRGQKVILAADLAEIYDVPAKVFNQAVKRNADRFPPDFLFQLTVTEVENLKLQLATSSLKAPQKKALWPIRLSVTAGNPTRPWAMMFASRITAWPPNPPLILPFCCTAFTT
jgi:hypothetical protein